MKLFLVQHGEAKSKSEDPTRPLNEVGLRNVEKVAAWMSKTHENVEEIWHSGKKRAEQTASIFRNHLLPPRGITPVSDLNPEDSILPIANIVNKIQDPLMIAGHLPYLGLLASYLITGDKHSQVIRFQNAGVVCLIREQGRWSIAWIVLPDLVD